MQKKILTLIILDQITKLVFSGRDFFLGPIHVHTVKNYGLAFSLNFGVLANIILILLGLGLFTVYFIQHRQEFFGGSGLVFSLIFAGAISNIVDRLYLGYVRDFIDLGLGFTFNFADAFVAVGIVLIFFYSSRSEPGLEI